MPFLNHTHFIIDESEFEKRDDLVFHELRSDSAGAEAGELLLDEPYVLSRLHDPDLILPTLGLHRNDIVASALVQADV